MRCHWCDSSQVIEKVNVVYWELPDGTRAIEIHETPCVTCSECGIIYQTEAIVNEIETQLLLIRTSELPKVLTFEELMKVPRLLKRNYFDFSKTD
ncbi:YokU family protein [Priestia taiwanensis]|uniref:YokU family protein n=1 Tax=Priestia taiwanensis TaxID=1347902 RepID=A0A917END9_9BACI|nr:YokU family protein [Priestia taiwanensis]MBM7362153.1 putative YokU family protein [Priestia taiwanensis]GGE59846.1 hypothetical protein GCM10007140_07760 [Priestia taiwanensis]